MGPWRDWDITEKLSFEGERNVFAFFRYHLPENKNKTFLFYKYYIVQ
jgi:hypothetical protein